MRLILLVIHVIVFSVMEKYTAICYFTWGRVLTENVAPVRVIDGSESNIIFEVQSFSYMCVNL